MKTTLIIILFLSNFLLSQSYRLPIGSNDNILSLNIINNTPHESKINLVVKQSPEWVSFETLSFENILIPSQLNKDLDLIFCVSDNVKKGTRGTIVIETTNYYTNKIFRTNIDIMSDVLPISYNLDNYPNPFNPNTVINYNMPVAGQVNLTVFNLLGEEVAMLVNEFQESGTHSAQFNASSLASGTYIYTLNVNGNSITKKMVLMK